MRKRTKIKLCGDKCLFQCGLWKEYWLAKVDDGAQWLIIANSLIVDCG